MIVIYKQFFTVVFWLISTILFSQNSIKINYNVVIDKDDIYEKGVEKRGISDINNELYLESLQEYNDYSFALLKNDSTTVFYLETYKNKSADKNKYFIMAGYTGVIYQTKNRVYSFNSYENVFSYKDFYSDWEITTEKKIIDGYTCYLAKGIKLIKHKDLVFRHPIHAWFCPELPYSVGPMGYGGLPGLILEIRIRNATFLASKVEMNSTEAIDFDFLNKHKKITLEELNMKIEQEMDDAIRSRRFKN
ncbi:GLPGLI family protein [Flavobacterium lacus]|uniref:GLPGLI family protein n=1 Tax=Flavobacterium lacus TaxID=1353778 RepID=A0A328WS01_9FLAO|nr:GLPGLI family protein [Flavobacterium lacus]RAR48065.1 GLPGLI family protein [Flavobacterium lacus]